MARNSKKKSWVEKPLIRHLYVLFQWLFSEHYRRWKKYRKYYSGKSFSRLCTRNPIIQQGSRESPFFLNWDESLKKVDSLDCTPGKVLPFRELTMHVSTGYFNILSPGDYVESPSPQHGMLKFQLLKRKDKNFNRNAGHHVIRYIAIPVEEVYSPDGTPYADDDLTSMLINKEIRKEKVPLVHPIWYEKLIKEFKRHYGDSERKPALR